MLVELSNDQLHMFKAALKTEIRQIKLNPELNGPKHNYALEDYESLFITVDEAIYTMAGSSSGRSL